MSGEQEVPNEHQGPEDDHVAGLSHGEQEEEASSEEEQDDEVESSSAHESDGEEEPNGCDWASQTHGLQTNGAPSNDPILLEPDTWFGHAQEFIHNYTFPLDMHIVQVVRLMLVLGKARLDSAWATLGPNRMEKSSVMLSIERELSTLKDVDVNLVYYVFLNRFGNDSSLTVENDAVWLIRNRVYDTVAPQDVFNEVAAAKRLIVYSEYVHESSIADVLGPQRDEMVAEILQRNMMAAQDPEDDDCSTD